MLHGEPGGSCSCRCPAARARGTPSGASATAPNTILPQQKVSHVIEQLDLLVVAQEDAFHAPRRALHAGPRQAASNPPPPPPQDMPPPPPPDEILRISHMLADRLLDAGGPR